MMMDTLNIPLVGKRTKEAFNQVHKCLKIVINYQQ